MKIGLVLLTVFGMMITPFTTVQAEDGTSTNNEQTLEMLPEGSVNSVNEVTASHDDSSQNTTALLGAGAVNEYGFDPEFFQWLVNYGLLPATGVTRADLESITEINSLNYQDFSSLAGIEQLTNLQRLVISNCPNIGDQEIQRLYGLGNLTDLELTFNELMIDISTVVPIAPQLVRFDWSDNGGHKEGYTYYRGAPIDISVLDGKLPNVEYLSLGDEPLLGTEALNSFTKVKSLSLYGTNIDTIDFVNNMPDLTSLNIADNRVSDLSPIANRPAVRTYAADQLIVLYGNDELRVDFNESPTFVTDWSFKISNSQFADLTGVSTPKASPAGNQQITWSNMTEADLLSITYKDPITMQRVDLKTIGAQYAASGLPANITAFNGAIYQSVVQKNDIEEPMLNDIYEDETMLTGTAPANMNVDVTCPHGHTTRVTVDATGNWSFTTDGEIHQGDIFTAVTVDTSGQTSDNIEEAVKPVTYTIDADDVTMTIGQLQTLQANGSLEAYVLTEAHATGTKISRTTHKMDVRADVTPLQNINAPTVVQITTYIPADSTNMLADKQITVTVTDADNGTLPNTGEDFITPIFIGGTGTLLGVGVLMRKRK